MEEEVDSGPIMSLPNEIVAIILQNVRCRDILSFGETCKRFNEFVNSNQFIWREKTREILPPEIADVVVRHGKGNWLQEIKHFFTVQSQVYNELMSMSPKYFCRVNDLSMDDVRNFFDLALNQNVNYYYVVYVLQNVIKQGTLRQQMNICETPFTMTEVYYAKAAVRYLTQTFLTVKWITYYMRKELTPAIVLNFFVQWVDPITSHPDRAIEDIIEEFLGKVESRFSNTKVTDPSQCSTVRDKLAKKQITEKQVMEVIRDILYTEYHVAMMPGANLCGLDICQVVRIKQGNLIAAAVMYEVLARMCGVHCELIAFSNHLFLEWRPETKAGTFKVDLETGQLVPQGRCPFAPASFREEYKYNPDAFIQYILASFLMTMGAKKNWYTQNAVYLLDFYSNNNMSDDNPYKDFVPCLNIMMHGDRLEQLDFPLDIEFINDAALTVVGSLAYLNSSPTQYTREVEVKHLTPNIKFATGMLAYHKKYDYLCVVRGWDLKCTTDWRQRVEIKDLEFGANQPFYSVIAADQSERYVAQENLIHVDRPARQTHLEDTIAKEFSHFDGCCYMPNKEKLAEYPDDDTVRSVHRNRVLQKTLELKEAL